VAAVLRHIRELLQRLDPEATQMSPGNLGVIFAPSLVHRPKAELLAYSKADGVAAGRLLLTPTPPSTSTAEQPLPSPSQTPNSTLEPEPEPELDSEPQLSEPPVLEQQHGGWMLSPSPHHADAHGEYVCRQLCAQMCGINHPRLVFATG
jgi:hypothetical protein